MTSEDEIMDTLNSILQKTVQIDVEVKYSQKQKDDSKRYLKEACDFAKEELDPKKISQLQYNEMKRIKIKWMEKNEKTE